MPKFTGKNKKSKVVYDVAIVLHSVAPVMNVFVAEGGKKSLRRKASEQANDALTAKDFVFVKWKRGSSNSGTTLKASISEAGNVATWGEPEARIVLENCTLVHLQRKDAPAVFESKLLELELRKFLSASKSMLLAGGKLDIGEYASVGGPVTQHHYLRVELEPGSSHLVLTVQLTRLTDTAALAADAPPVEVDGNARAALGSSILTQQTSMVSSGDGVDVANWNRRASIDELNGVSSDSDDDDDDHDDGDDDDDDGDDNDDDDDVGDEGHVADDGSAARARASAAASSQSRGRDNNEDHIKVPKARSKSPRSPSKGSSSFSPRTSKRKGKGSRRRLPGSDTPDTPTEATEEGTTMPSWRQASAALSMTSTTSDGSGAMLSTSAAVVGDSRDAEIAQLRAELAARDTRTEQHRLFDRTLGRASVEYSEGGVPCVAAAVWRRLLRWGALADGGAGDLVDRAGDGLDRLVGSASRAATTVASATALADCLFATMVVASLAAALDCAQLGLPPSHSALPLRARVERAAGVALAGTVAAAQAALSPFLVAGVLGPPTVVDDVDSCSSPRPDGLVLGAELPGAAALSAALARVVEATDTAHLPPSLRLSLWPPLLASLASFLLDHMLDTGDYATFGGGLRLSHSLESLSSTLTRLEPQLSRSMVVDAFAPLKQAATILTLPKESLLDPSTRLEVAPKLTQRQLARLVSGWAVDDFDTLPLHPGVLAALKKAADEEGTDVASAASPNSHEMSLSLSEADVLTLDAAMENAPDPQSMK